MHRQPSRNAANMDAIDCIVTTNDLALENDILNKESEQRRGTNNSSRRDQTSKRSNDKSTRRSPTSVTRKRDPSPRSISSSRPQRQRPYVPTPRDRRVSSSSPSPPPSSQRDRRPVTTVKRPHSPSRSPHGRRGQTHRSRPESTRERAVDTALTSTPSFEEQSRSKKPTSKHDTTDLSFISEDESTKPRDTRSNGVKTKESPSVPKDNKLHSTPSLPVPQANSNESLLEMSTIPKDCDLSLFAKSSLSTNNTSSISTTPVNPTNDLMQTLELFTKYQMIQTSTNTNKELEAYSKEILLLLKKQLDLQKTELNCREREIKLRERQLDEREKQFNEKAQEATSLTSVQSEPPVVLKSISVEDKSQQKPEIVAEQHITKAVSREESVTVKSDSPSTNAPAKDSSVQPSLTRRNHGKSRFSQSVVDPAIFASSKPVPIELYSDDHDESQPVISSNPIPTVKKPTIPKILAPSEPIISLVDGDLKVTSSNSCRKVEFQSGNSDKVESSKGSSHDLRLILSNNRTKQQNDGDDATVNDSQLIQGGDDDDDEDQQQTESTSKEDKYQSHEYSQQRSVTSASLETIIDNNNDRRMNRHHHQHRPNNNRRPYASQSSSSNSNERSYNHGGSSAQQQSKYGSNERRHEADLRSRLPGYNKHPKSSRPSHQNNY